MKRSTIVRSVAVIALSAAASVAACSIPSRDGAKTTSAHVGEPAAGPAPSESACVRCHREITPGVVGDWLASKHSQNDPVVGCESCHGDQHRDANDVAKVRTVTADTCKTCHGEQYEQFAKSKHALAWAAMNAMPTTHAKPVAMIDGMKGCGGCHKVGLKSEDEIKRLKSVGSGFGYASCDACHTRHTFSLAEARQPEACATCHMGFDHPQWEMYSTSKHGVRHGLKRDGALPESAAAPTCQTCHMQGGDHAVITPWGFLAVRTNGLAPYPGESEQWWKDRVTILQALGVLDPEGKPTGRLDVVAGAKVARLSAEEFDRERAKLMTACSECHSENFAKGELAKGDQMIEQIDRLLAEAIRIVAALYADGTLAKPASYTYAFPDLLTFHDSPTPIENLLFRMHLEHRMRAFQGTFHANPDYALWYGWSEMQQDLTEIRAMAEELRAGKK
ncbi:MAG: cytochrome C [Planctomycetes bacterium]|nr:cytochrome C [Planctomycetota bacterium]